MSNKSVIAKLQRKIYSTKTPSKLGFSNNRKNIPTTNRRPHTSAVIGGALGDEGKGRTVVNLINRSLENPDLDQVIVVRFQGGNNAGHSLESGGIKWAQHQIPSGIHRDQVYGIMDSGMVVHPEDLMTEYQLVSQATRSDLTGKLKLSADAIFCSDLERAKEVLNRFLSHGAKGGTGRGIGPSYAGHLDRQGLHIRDLLSDDWQEKLSNKYQQLEKIFAAFDMNLSEIEVPDFLESKKQNLSVGRTLGKLPEFLDRLSQARRFLLSEELVTNTFPLHHQYFHDPKTAMLFEGSQAVGLNPWLGTYPDVTTSDTSLFGIQTGTRYWLAEQIRYRLGVIKATYTSSVGQRRMATQVDLPYPVEDPSQLDSYQAWADYVRTKAHEFGTTTKRPRDILHMDLGFIGYNARMGGIEALVATHLDIALEDEPIKVCWGYANSSGEIVTYQPGLVYQADITPQYIELPSWDGLRVQGAQTMEDLPDNCRRYLGFFQAVTGVPIAAVTTGPNEYDYIEVPGYFDG